MSVQVFVPNAFDRRVEACRNAYNAAIWRSDLDVAERLWDELQRLRAERDAYYGQRS